MHTAEPIGHLCSAAWGAHVTVTGRLNEGAPCPGRLGGPVGGHLCTTSTGACSPLSPLLVFPYQSLDPQHSPDPLLLPILISGLHLIAALLQLGLKCDKRSGDKRRSECDKHEQCIHEEGGNAYVCGRDECAQDYQPWQLAPSPGQLDPQAELLAPLHVASPSTIPHSLAMLVSPPPLTTGSFRPAHTQQV